MFWNSLFRRRGWESRLDAELRFHQEEQIRAYLAEGLSEEQARRRVFQEFGTIEIAKDECRDQRPFVWLEHALQDIRYAARLLVRDRALSAVAIVSLALGIGATTAVFSVVDRILFRSLPYRDAERLVSVGLAAPMLPYDFMFGASYLEFRTHRTGFEAVTSWSGISDCDLTDGEAVKLACASVETSFLPTLGIAPMLGANFTAEDDGPDKPRTVLLSHAIWRSRFGARSDVLGRMTSLDGQPARVIGVLPPAFETPTLAHADLVIPQRLDEASLQRAVTGRPLRVIARLAPGVTVGQAQAAGSVLVSRSLRSAPSRLDREVRPRVQTLRDLRAGDAKAVSWILFGSVIAVLLLACANVANLLLARTVSRERELAVRAALGAGRSRLIRQAITESLLLALVGGIAGTALAYGLVRAFVRAAPEGIPQIAQAGLDQRVFAFTCLCSVICGLLFGMGPALASSDREVLSAGRSATAGRRGHRQALMVAQLAVSLALLTGASLLVRAFWRFQQTPMGMETQNIITASLSLSPQRYPTPRQQLAFSEKLEARLCAAGEFETVAISDSRPPGGPLRSKALALQQIDGRPQDSPVQGTVVWRAVTPDYFHALGIPIREGRGFSDEDRDPGRDVMMVSLSLARRLFHGSKAVGHFIGNSQIVGVAGDVRNSGGTARDDPEYYVPRSRDPNAPMYNAPDELRRVVAVIRTRLAGASASHSIREIMAELDHSLPVTIETMTESVGRLSVRPRFNALLLALFAAIGLGLCACGLYGVLGFLVAQRTREIGVRMALGATPRAIAALVLGSVGRWLVVGMACGLVLSIGLSLVLRSLLYGIPAYDPPSWALAAAALVATALGAAWQPARRAIRTGPLEALRHE